MSAPLVYLLLQMLTQLTRDGGAKDVRWFKGPERAIVHTFNAVDHPDGRLVMEAAEVREQPCTMDDLRAASEAFLASTTREAQSIAAIEDLELPEGERTREVGAALRQRIEEELAAG